MKWIKENWFKVFLILIIFYFIYTIENDIRNGIRLDIYHHGVNLTPQGLPPLP